MQSELSFSEPSVAPVATIEEVEWLVALLKKSATCEKVRERNGWTTAAELTAAADGTKNDRKIRAIARAAAPRIVSFPGSPGYKLWEECTVEELNHCLDAWASQIRDNTCRRMLYEQALFTRFRGSAP